MNRLMIIAFIAGICASYFGGTLGLIAAESATAVRTEPVFVYNSLDNPIVRLYACKCFTKEMPVRVEGFARGTSGKLIDSPSSSIRGKLVWLSKEELLRLDDYIGSPESHYRIVVTTDTDDVAWAYIRRIGY